MPVGGLWPGQLYLGGDGKLWHWDIFNQVVGTGDGHYAHPPKPESPLDQGFAVRVEADGKAQEARWTASVFPTLPSAANTLSATVEYKADGFPVEVNAGGLLALYPSQYSGFQPARDGSAFHSEEYGQRSGRCAAGRLAAKRRRRLARASIGGQRRNRIKRRRTTYCLSARPRRNRAEKANKPPIVFADFEGNDYGAWKVTGEAFGKGPVRGTLPHQQRVSGYQGKKLVNSWAGNDDAVGTLTSPEFTDRAAFHQLPDRRRQ